MRAIFVSILVFCCTVPAWAGNFTLTSPDITDGGTLSHAQVLNDFGCEGGNTSPALSWSNPPEGTRSYALTVYDPDAPTGSGWWHWVVFNIPASVQSLPAGAGSGKGVPAGAMQSRTDFGKPGYGGACPPPGPSHRYIFTVHALDVEQLDLSPDSSAAMVGFMLNGHTLGKASITATYGR
ncbi:kinase inhibitor [Oceanidesulfovibrio indonesiensis]|uniref:Kinase inhibitor n=1 Tax=Oceanidesulfovibrio indonesiensis TaxID=54767 RepID=A0A7M3ME45_9BACT|nr:kinase inhibitor [Oceanidesulfovibrio indonesiensis]TVM16437.1 kinase inhibitor [Oceanidesulfovibrio indonesiensis]